MPKQSELTLTFRRERHAFPNGEGTPNFRRVIIGEGSNGDETAPITIKGEASEGDLVPGMPYRFYGHYTNHPKYGRQFSFASYTAEQPATEEGIVAYLSQLTGERIGTKRGIGKGTAYLLWEEFNHESVRMLREKPIECSDRVRGLSDTVATAASKWLVKHEAIEECKIELMGLLNGRGFPKKTVDAAIQKWGAKANEFIKANPYLLMNFRGCGFLSTDKFYIDLGKSPKRLKRQALCGWYAVACKTKQDGDTWHRVQYAEQKIRSQVGSCDGIDFNRAIELAVRGGILTRRIDADRSVWVAEKRKADNESRLAEYVRGALEDSGSDWPTWPTPDGLLADLISVHQQKQLNLAIQKQVGCLAGSPGTGKTYTASALIKAIISEHGHHSISVVAPTGKAAVRLSEALSAANVPLAATTIHRLLGVLQADDGSGWQFEYNAGHPLPHQFIIVDESSMIDTDLMCSLMAARAPGTHILFIGDHRQLAPVGHGCPFYDLQSAGVPTGELTEVQRNAGRIVKACAEMRDHHRFNVSTETSLSYSRKSVEDGENLIISRIGDNPEDHIECLFKSITWAARELDINIRTQLQVVVAVNRKSPLSREELNKRLQSEFNPTGDSAKGNPFRVGDKLINLKNGFFPSQGNCPEADEDGNLFVANGEQAIALKVEPARTIARLQGSERIIVIPHGVQCSGGDSDNDSDSDSAPSTGVGSWDLGYAISVHKSQGSEWPVVIVMLDEYQGAKMLCTRNWIYTAGSRAKTLCLMIGKKSTADAMLRRDGLRRKTFLVEEIKGEHGGQANLQDGSNKRIETQGGNTETACPSVYVAVEVSSDEVMELFA